MLAEGYLKWLNVSTDPWGFSNNSLGLISSIVLDIEDPKILCFGAGNAAAALAPILGDGSMLVLEEHPAISEHIKNEIGEYDEDIVFRVEKTRSIDVNGFGCYSYEQQEFDADVIIVDGPRNSSFGRAHQLLTDALVERERWIFWANANNPMVMKALEYFESRMDDRAITSILKDTREGLAVSRVMSCSLR